jgi:cytidylate kinase
VKIYLDADPATRARRRARELEERGLPVPLEQVLAEMERRDRRDRTRADSPLRAAEGAEVIESSGLDVGQVVEKVLRVVQAHPGCPSGTGGDPRGRPPGGD